MRFPRLDSFARWLTARRIRAHATMLAICLWGVCAVDFLTPGPFDRAGNIKFQDFLSFYISGKLISEGRSADLYNDQLRREELLRIVSPIDTASGSVSPPTAPSPMNVRLPNLYGPQFALLFVPLAHLPFPVAAQVWVALNLILFFLCVAVVLRFCPSLIPHTSLVLLCAVAFPPLFHFFVRGQNSVLLLLCLTAAFVAFRSQREWLAGLALGCMVFKPQFLIAIPLILLLAAAWKALAALLLSAAAQMLFARIYFGASMMSAYLDTLLHPARWITSAELALAPTQMHSLRAFCILLVPWPTASFALYVLSSVIVIVTATSVWKSPSPLALRFSALILAAILVSPHLFVYDLLVLAPVLLLLAEWSLASPQLPCSKALRPLLYLTFVLSFIGPLSRWTHLQLSVPLFCGMLWLLVKIPRMKTIATT